MYTRFLSKIEAQKTDRISCKKSNYVYFLFLQMIVFKCLEMKTSLHHIYKNSVNGRKYKITFAIASFYFLQNSFLISHLW